MTATTASLRSYILRLTGSVDLVTETCCNCGVLFAMPNDYNDGLRRTGRSFWCPNGHPQSYARTEADRLREQLATARELAEREARRRRDAEQRAETIDRSRNAYRGHVTRLKNRIAAGKCPCCHTEFPDLATHLADEHPGYAAEAVE